MQDDGAKDVNVDISAVLRAGERILSEGQKLSYDVVKRRGAKCAVNLTLL